MLDQTFPLPKLVKFYSVVVALTDNWFWLMLICLCSRRSGCAVKSGGGGKNVGHELKMLFFSPPSAIVAIDTANLQLSPGRRWIEYSWKSRMNSIRRGKHSRYSTIFSGFVSHPRRREYSRCIHRIAIENRGQIKLHTYLWFVETKCAARREIDSKLRRRADGRVNATLFTRNSIACSRYPHTTGLLSIWHWIFTVRFPNRFQSKRVTRTLPSINKDELRRFGEKYFMKSARHEIKTVVSAQRASFGERTFIYCDSSASPETFLVVIRTDDSGCYRQPWRCKVVNVLIAAYQLTLSLQSALKP